MRMILLSKKGVYEEYELNYADQVNMVISRLSGLRDYYIRLGRSFAPTDGTQNQQQGQQVQKSNQQKPTTQDPLLDI